MTTSILNGIQAREYNRAQTMQIFFDENSKTYILSQPFNSEVQLFYDNNQQLQSLVPVKKERGEGITKDKAEVKKDVAEAAGFICDMTTAYAVKINDNDLKTGVSYTGSAIYNMKDGNILGFVTSLVTIVTPLLSNEDFAPYSITADTLAEVTELATTFNNNIGKAAIIDTNSSIASRNIDEVLKAIRGNIAQFDLLISFFKKKNPDFINSYRKAIIIHNTGIRHSGVKGVINNAATSAPVQEVILTLTGRKTIKTTTTDSEGAYQIIRFMAGRCRLTVSAPGYESYTTEITIVRGKIMDLNISLQAQVIEFKTA